MSPCPGISLPAIFLINLHLSFFLHGITCYMTRTKPMRGRECCNKISPFIPNNSSTSTHTQVSKTSAIFILYLGLPCVAVTFPRLQWLTPACGESEIGSFSIVV
ncbi:hypothetical protein I3843_03G062400 [Carya illinoinensis]|nr:hypothetical protein I3843_03G062400 [Carya illinoinensis]